MRLTCCCQLSLSLCSGASPRRRPRRLEVEWTTAAATRRPAARQLSAPLPRAVLPAAAAGSAETSKSNAAASDVLKEEVSARKQLPAAPLRHAGPAETERGCSAQRSADLLERGPVANESARRAAGPRWRRQRVLRTRLKNELAHRAADSRRQRVRWAALLIHRAPDQIELCSME